MVDFYYKNELTCWSLDLLCQTLSFFFFTSQLLQRYIPPHWVTSICWRKYAKTRLVDPSFYLQGKLLWTGFLLVFNKFLQNHFPEGCQSSFSLLYVSSDTFAPLNDMRATFSSWQFDTKKTKHLETFWKNTVWSGKCLHDSHTQKNVFTELMAFVNPGHWVCSYRIFLSSISMVWSLLASLWQKNSAGHEKQWAWRLRKEYKAEKSYKVMEKYKSKWCSCYK